MALTRKQEFCLRRLSENVNCPYRIGMMAAASGDNTTIWRGEWANEPLLQLRKMGLAELTGGKTRMGRKAHHITAAGRAALIEEESNG